MIGKAIHHTAFQTVRMLWMMPQNIVAMYTIINFQRAKCKNRKREYRETILGFPDAIPAVIHALKKIPVLEVDEDGILFEETLLIDVRHDVVRFERALGF